MKRSPEIQLFKGISPPILEAQELYRKYSKVPFTVDLIDYVYTGLIVSRPTCFAMAKVTDLAKPGEPHQWAWFIRVAVGDMFELLNCLPCYLEKICFCRRGKEDFMRVYDLKRFIRLVGSTRKRR